MKWTDAELISAYRGGNLDAFQLFYEKYKDVLYSWLYNRCGEEAGDIFQEAFIKFIDAAREKELTNPKAYLFQIALNLIRNLGRKTKLFSLQDEYDIPADANEDEMPVSEQELQESLQELARQKPLFYDVLHLHIFAKMTFAEISKLKQKSQDTIASRYRYGIHYLRKFLQEKQPQLKEVEYV